MTFLSCDYRSIIINLTCDEAGNVNKADYHEVRSLPIDTNKFVSYFYIHISNK